MLKKVILVYALLAASLPLIAGCGSVDTNSAPTAGSVSAPTLAATSSSGGGGDVQEIRVVAKDNVFDPKSYTAVAGKPLRITAVNQGQNVHEVEVKGLLPETKLAPGQIKTVDVPSVGAGTYRVYCEIHGDSGMEGELVVK